ncbi:tail protein [Anabaena phage A-4L]|uniref:Tail tubular protein B n=1 Tax=Anabaena phage A-4L TaxID=1357732 RepID=A0A059PYE2_9CAUD|nr:tail protein [Anabaena phage A-4L]AGR48558.1 tail tubular protein B [Anabaena phage A-4L]
MTDQFERNNIRNNEVAAEQSIQSNNFGGLNTLASPLNVPYQDSPLLLNTTVDTSGQVYKRKGTRITYTTTGTSTGCYITGFTSGLAYQFQVAKRGRDILLFQTTNDVTSLLLTKSNVWDTRAEAVRPSVVTTSEVTPRVIFATGVNKPVQLLFVEQQTTQTANGTSVVFSSADRFVNASTANCLVYVNRVLVSAPSFSYNAGTKQLTVSNLGSTVIGDVIDLVSVTWQWWAESQFWYGDRFFGSTTRFNSVSFDRVVKIPTSITTQNNGSDPYYRMRLYKQSNRTGSPNLNEVVQPQLADDWAFSDGSIYNYSVNDYPNPSPFWVVFGALVGGGQPSTVYFSRRRGLGFANGTSVQASKIDVVVNGVQRTPIYTPGSAPDSVYRNYYTYFADTTGAATGTSSTSLVNGIFFDAIPLGLATNDTVEASNNTNIHIGSASIATRYNYNDGSYIPAFGLGDFADYLNGYYPSVVTFFQGRLVFGGFPHRPLQVVFSNVNDNITPGRYYNSFSITDDNTALSSAFDIILNSRPDDRVVALIEWQSSLFILTRQAVFRANGGSSILSSTNRVISYVSSNGCTNSRCIVRTDFNVMYLSDTGVYNINPLVENGEYTVKELSIKIRDKFGVTREPVYEELPWMAYDSVNKQVLLGYPDVGQTNTSRYVYVYNTYRESWTEYNTPCGFNIWSTTEYTDRLLGTSVCSILYTTTSSGTPSNFIIIRWNASLYIDFIQRKTHNGSSYELTTQPAVTHTTNVNQRRYGVNFTLTRQNTAFTINPVTTVNDLYVTLDGTLLTPNVDYIKEETGYIYLLSTFSTGQTLKIASSPEGNTTPNSWYTVYVNNIRQVSPTPSAGTFTLGATNGDIINWGVNYLTIYTTPQFLWNSLGNFKRTQHAYLFLDNRDGVGVYVASDVNNGQDINQLTELYRVPINFNLSVMYNNQLDGSTSYDVMGYDSMYWDEGVFDVSSPYDQYQPYQTLKIPITGIGYAFQMLIWNHSDEYFKLGGYQIIAKQKGKRHIGRY